MLRKTMFCQPWSLTRLLAYVACILGWIPDRVVSNETQDRPRATSLFSTATPMIRYLLGDIATPLDDECPCGRGLPLLKNIEGRTVDFIVTPEGQYISPYTIMYTLQDIEGVLQYKVTQRKDYSIELQVKTLGEHSESILQGLRQRCTLLFGEIPVTIRPVDGIDSPKGSKFQPVESHLPRCRRRT